jgi:hypothetical protein
MSTLGNYFDRFLMKQRKVITPPSASLPHLLPLRLLRTELANSHAVTA